ncbi:MAG: 23S rRNA (guanosine(2251)-2'-O)-methyltransferase RlmB [Clostridia bacterium]|nr:23S rRNA (guanosine(2251)-2'-O)-methyltransferase RlmB [Clostridia bacterium]
MEKKFGYKNNKNKNARRDFHKDKRETHTEAEENNCVVSGRNAVRELLSGDRDVDKIYVSSGDREGSIKLLVALAIEKKIPVVEVDKSKLDAISGGTRHQGIVALAAEHNYSTVDDILAYADERGEKPFVIILDGVEDPHNLGAIIRSAECLGAHGVIIPKRRAVGLTPTVAKAAAGATEYVRVARVTNIATTIDELKERGLWIYAADMGGSDYVKTDLTGSMALVLGSEGFGISRLVKEKCDFTVSIKLHGRVNSMNVSCAAAIIFAEVARQRDLGGADIG